MCVYVYIYINMCKYKYVYIYVYIYIYLCKKKENKKNIHMYICIYMYIYTYVNAYKRTICNNHVVCKQRVDKWMYVGDPKSCFHIDTNLHGIGIYIALLEFG